jgi:ubiquinone/menaquinone biosynthesis C-methylase UbiE
MSTYVLMKILESMPNRYDRGIRMLTLGRLDNAYDRLTVDIQEGQRVLDIGCGTGALTIRAAQKKAMVKGIDINAQMLEIAQKRVNEAKLSPYIEFCEMGVAELGNEDTERYDVIMSGLCFSELTEDELRYTLKEAKRMLKPEGLLLLAVEVRPESIAKRLLHWFIKFPLVIVTYVVTQTTTRSVKNLPEKIENAGFLIASIKLNFLENFIELVGRKPNESH